MTDAKQSFVPTDRCPNCGQELVHRVPHVEWGGANDGYWTCKAPEPFHPKPIAANGGTP